MTLPFFIEATMAKAKSTAEPVETTSQTGTTPNPFPANAQDFSASDDEILDNFADGPNPNDDGTPLGLGGEKGKQSEPASSTLEADLVREQTPGEVSPPEETAGEAEPDQGPAGESGEEETSEPDDSTEPEIPPMLLQMAGYADAEAAKADGLGTPEALNAFIRGRGQLLAPKTTEPKAKPISGYRRPEPQAAPQQAEEPPAEPSEFKPFELSEEEVEIIDETLQGTIRRQNEHYQRLFEAQQKELQSLRDHQLERETLTAEQQAEAELRQLDKAVQGLGDDWQDLFGEGDFDDLERRGQTDITARLAREYRIELFETVQAIRDANAERGFEPMDLQREIGFGLMQRFPDKFQQLHSVTSSTSNGGAQRRTSLNRPTQRRPSRANQDELLTKLHKKYPDAGFTAQEEDEFDGEF